MSLSPLATQQRKYALHCTQKATGNSLLPGEFCLTGKLPYQSHFLLTTLEVLAQKAKKEQEVSHCPSENDFRWKKEGRQSPSEKLEVPKNKADATPEVTSQL